MGDELERHKREIAQANKSSRVWSETEIYEESMRLCSIVGSHMASAGEAAWRWDAVLMNTHLRHAREALILALKVAKELGK